MRKFILFLLCACGFALPAPAQWTPNPPFNNTPATSTGVTANIPATSTFVAFAAPSANFVLINNSSTVTLYWSLVSPASSTTNHLAPNFAGYSYSGAPLLGIYIMGSSGSDTYTLTAH